MKIKVGKAVKLFFGGSSLEMVYFEAVSNSLDADATEIEISISATSYNQPQTLQITISDNGIGITDERYIKFSNLLDVEESSHKGLGRLVYLYYFDSAKITTFYGNKYKREFDFTENFQEENNQVTEVGSSQTGTTITMTGYTLSRLKQYSFIQPEYLKAKIQEEFYSKLFQLKQEGKAITINIKSQIENQTSQTALTNSDLPELEAIELESPVDLISKFYLHYAISEVEAFKTSLIAAVSVDNRTFKVDIVAEENKPAGYNMVFLLYSDWFNGKVDPSRQNLDIPETSFQEIQAMFRKAVINLIEEKIPTITERNKKTKNDLINRYPHLSGYFNTENIGYITSSEILKKAQDHFFRAQKELLDANSLTPEQYEKSIELSARALTEYILFRQLTINNLKNTTREDSEATIHKLFSKTRMHFRGENLLNDLYINNAWLLDDKYMTYEAVLSDEEMGSLIQTITDSEEVQRDDDRPDIALVFSNNPNTSNHFDVVIVELKKRGISLEENMKAVTQLEKRARKLMKYYQNKIQRIWYYGLIEFNDEIELHLTGEYKELYSSGKMYYKETKVAVQKNPDIIIPIGIFIWDIDAIVKDADARNSAFLNLVKSKFIVE